MALALFKNKAGQRSWQAEGFGDNNKDWTRVAKVDLVHDGIAPPIDDDEPGPADVSTNVTPPK